MTSESCLIPRPHYCALSMHFWSRGLSEFLRASLDRSSRMRHRNALTEKAWKDAVQGLGTSE